MPSRDSECAFQIYARHWGERQNRLDDRTEIHNDLGSQENWFRHQYLFHEYLPRSNFVSDPGTKCNDEQK